MSKSVVGNGRRRKRVEWASAAGREDWHTHLPELDTRVELIQALIPIGLEAVNEGFKETLTLHRLGLFKELGRSFKMTNCIENLNSLIGNRTGKVDCWRNSEHKHRWLATAILDIEPLADGGWLSPPAPPSSGVAAGSNPEQQGGSMNDHTGPIGSSTRNGIDPAIWHRMDSLLIHESIKSSQVTSVIRSTLRDEVS